MAEDDDQSSRTEEPSSQRLDQARERGEAAQSQDVKSWAALACSTAVLAYLAPGACERLTLLLLPFIERPESLDADLSEARLGMLDVLLEVTWVTAPIFGLLLLGGIAAGMAQTGLIWAPSKLAPDLGRLSPLSGLKRIASKDAVIELVKGVLKVSFAAAAGVLVIAPLFGGLDRWAELSAAAALQASHAELVRMAGGVTIAVTLVAIADYVYQRFSFLQRQRMTLQEVRDEHKESDGDPHLKARVRQLRQERSRTRMMAAVPTATVVITNPTHFAVALSYDPQTMPAPKLVAKGVDSLARRIRELAAAHAVPVVENPPLARALHRSVDLDADVPAEHYHAVAQIIGYVMRLKRGTR